MGDESPPSPPPTPLPNLDCDRSMGHLDRYMCLMRMQNWLGADCVGPRIPRTWNLITQIMRISEGVSTRLCYDLCVVFTVSLEPCERLRGE